MSLNVCAGVSASAFGVCACDHERFGVTVSTNAPYCVCAYSCALMLSGKSSFQHLHAMQLFFDWFDVAFNDFPKAKHGPPSIDPAAVAG